ncbi:Probable molybdopterin binding domain protein [Acididesulfobacillus acetoxydans]|uniref:Molybdopterin molybdenumtransferase n=1 Tax=Acididesulfobacillus acetoxydans TaxID=1561005 RepID=A0A8S0W7M0_9FIRM|nr:molybdopterin-binding protein [Acididesulfobacillus acetoxydans]CAA7600919.1 Probable molybdopterin binding domain protein [Acididesulfobacillus acetoxydans]CEJ08924.1 Molybdopterin binding domain protein [Acididesulfobacillus acetoxydans]
MEWELLEKTTFWIDDIELNHANLGEAAKIAAEALGLMPEEVMVVDVRPGMIAFDVLKHKVQAERVAGKGEEILKGLAALPGVTRGEKAAIHSEGVLGFIALDPEEVKSVLEASAVQAQGISQAVARRAIVFSSGAEVIAKKIEDTNSPYITRTLESHGYQARFGGILEDDAKAAAAVLEGALEAGYGLIITTGGVGAEDKDYSIEAVLRLDPKAYTPWILKFTPDFHRHHKEGVRIAVGQVGIALLVALPGPHEEARLGCDRLVEGLAHGLTAPELADVIASALRERWHSMMN